MNDVFFSNKKQDWETPKWLFEELDREFGFTLDPCSDDSNYKVKNHYTESENGLVQDWGGQTVFVNPPYGKELPKWVEKSYLESHKTDTKVVMLIPARTDTRWFHNYIYNRCEVRFIKGRLKFEGAEYFAPFPSMIVIFDSEEYLTAYDEVKSLLNAYRMVELHILQLKEAMERIRDEHKMPSKGMDGMPRTHKIHDLSDFAVRIDELYTELQAQYNESLKQQVLAARLINELNDPIERNVIWARYMQLDGQARKMDAIEIGERMGYSDRQIYRFIDAGLQHLAEIWPDIKEKYITKT